MSRFPAAAGGGPTTLASEVQALMQARAAKSSRMELATLVCAWKRVGVLGWCCLTASHLVAQQQHLTLSATIIASMEQLGTTHSCLLLLSLNRYCPSLSLSVPVLRLGLDAPYGHGENPTDQMPMFN